MSDHNILEGEKLQMIFTGEENDGNFPSFLSIQTWTNYRVASLTWGYCNNQPVTLEAETKNINPVPDPGSRMDIYCALH